MENRQEKQERLQKLKDEWYAAILQIQAIYKEIMNITDKIKEERGEKGLQEKLDKLDAEIKELDNELYGNLYD